jgi:hypothetical protein
MNSLTITYFHTGIRTIIGVESFHGPVRDGKGWYQLAMFIRHKGCAGLSTGVVLDQPSKYWEEVVGGDCVSLFKRAAQRCYSTYVY